MTRARRMLIGGFSVTIAVGPARSPAQSPARTQPAVVITHPAQRPTLASRTVHLIRRDPVIAVPLDSVRNIRLAPGEFLGQRTGYGSHVELREQQLGMVGGGVPRVVTVRPLPFIYTATTIDGKRVRLQPAVVSEGLGYVRDSNSFVDSMLIALEDRDSPGDNEVLSGPIRINLSSQGHIVSPDTVDVTRTNLPPVRVRVRAGVAVDSVSIRVIPTFDPRGEYGWLAVRPAILFHNVRRRAVGLGVAIVIR